MIFTKETCISHSMRDGFRLAFLCALLTFGVSAQTVQSVPQSTTSPANDKAAEALEALGLTEDENAKARMASALIKLGDKDRKWWDYLAEGGQQAIDSDAPSAQQFNAGGRVSSAEPSPQYLAWVKSHGLTEEAAEEQLLRKVGVLFALGGSGDPRAIPLLRQGLSSPD